MDTRSQDARRFFAFLAVALAIVGGAIVAFTLYERVALGVARLGTGDRPHLTLYYLIRLAVIALLSVAAIVGLYRLRDYGTVIHKRSLPQAKRHAVYGMMAVAAAFVALFAVAPMHFHRIALEDGPVEWASAVLPLAASVAFLYTFVVILRSEIRDTRRRVALGLTALFATVLFVIGMEEISWMQRVFNIATPAIFAGNEQQETNLHNMYNSLVFNIVYRTGVLGGLIVLPFLVEVAPRNLLFEWFGDFLPRRFVVAASAPLLGFEYNAWNFALGPFLFLVALAVLACYALAARDRGDRREQRLFATLIAFVVASQAVFLGLGSGFAHPWIISEFRELLLAAGLAVFAWDVTTRLVARYRAAHAPVGALAA
jgi:hypothetical protein